MLFHLHITISNFSVYQFYWVVFFFPLFQIVRFQEKESHQIFLEPEGRNVPELYVQVCYHIIFSLLCDRFRNKESRKNEKNRLKKHLRMKNWFFVWQIEYFCFRVSYQLSSSMTMRWWSLNCATCVQILLSWKYVLCWVLELSIITCTVNAVVAVGCLYDNLIIHHYIPVCACVIQSSLKICIWFCIIKLRIQILIIK